MTTTCAPFDSMANSVVVIAAMPLANSSAVLGALERGQLALRHALRRVAVAAVLLALDAALEVVGELGGVGEGVGRRLDDRRR